MEKNALRDILQSPYKRESWIKTLQFLSGQKNALTIFVEPKEITLSFQKQKNIVRKLIQLGTLKTTDNTVLPIFEIELQDKIKIEYNRVGVNELIKDYILKDAQKGAIATYHHKDCTPKEWRFSFISKHGASDFFEEAETIETTPKKYTYIFGTREPHRTALERLFNLKQSSFNLEDFFEAFNVEPVSKNFFKEYKNFYLDFVHHLATTDNRSVFENVYGKDKVDLEIRNFVKRLLGRIVFLYFLQKKNWLAATNKNYEDGDPNFLENLYKAEYGEIEQDQFYGSWLSKLFFEALNTPNRTNDAFELPNKTKRWIPFLNGGLFEENQEPKNHKKLNFPVHLFEELFHFFNGYNFTIYENSPEDHIVAVDPEMLGNIFENLLEDNADKGAFYTPKEIVHYMTQESLIEYLHTKTNKPKAALENLVKHQNGESFSRDDLLQIENYIDKVKICDPAIGSGAFPMGLLQEIFALKQYIHFAMGYEIWSPAKIKQDIIQNSIYGVDIETGAVDIARLRFWLSLVVDEPTPKPLPNLDYKIMQGNSLIEEFAGIDLATLMEEEGEKIVEQTALDLGDDYNAKITIFDKADKAHFQQLLKKYYAPEEWEKQHNEKVDKYAVKKEINNFVEGRIHAIIDKEKRDLEAKVEKFEKDHNIKNENQLQQLIEAKKINPKAKGFKDYQTKKERLKEIDQTEQQLINFQYTDDRPYFMWHVFFNDVFEQGGFDIVIGNPPYVSALTMRRSYIEKSIYKKYYPEATGSYDLYILFLLKAKEIINKNGIYSWIIPNKFLIANYASKTKNILINEYNLQYALNVSSFNVFDGVGVYPIIIFGGGNKSIEFKEYYLKDYSHLSKRKFSEPKKLPKYRTLKDFNIKIGSGATGFQAKEIIKYLHQEKVEGSIPFTVSGNVDRYSWNNKKVKYQRESYKEAYYKKNDFLAISKWNFWCKPKIVIAGMTKIIEAVYVEEPLALGVGIYGIYDFADYNPYFLTALLNSQYYSYYFINKFKDKHLAGGYLAINKGTIENFPLIPIEMSIQVDLSLLSQIIHLYINNKVNTQIALFFEEVIDACVYELYFKEEMHSKQINVLDLVQAAIHKVFGNFENVDLTKEQDKIWQLYNKLKDSEVQKRMRMFVSKSPEVLKPIIQHS